MYELYGLTEGDFAGAYEAWESSVHPDDAEGARVAVQRALDGEEKFDTEFRIIRPDGKTRHIAAAADVHRDAEGSAVRMVGINLDVTARREAELELERSNRELEQFAYIASHDLREPLRKVTAFGSRLIDLYGRTLDERGRDYVTRMSDAAARMQSLVDDLLALSRVSSRKQPFESIALDDVVRGVVEDLSVSINESGAEIRAGPLPTVEGDATQVRQLFQNLIANALKFQRPGVSPVIRIECRATGGNPSSFGGEIVFEDNGIGFEPEHAERIFGPFQRLHGREEYEGTGMGLSICERIVRRHGGTIRAEGRPGDGATFTVRLPSFKQERAA